MKKVIVFSNLYCFSNVNNKHFLECCRYAYFLKITRRIQSMFKKLFSILAVSLIAVSCTASAVFAEGFHISTRLAGQHPKIFANYYCTTFTRINPRSDNQDPRKIKTNWVRCSTRRIQRNPT